MRNTKSLIVLASFLALASITLLRSQNVRPSPGYKSLARYMTEEDAVRKGERLGLGQATLEGPSETRVDSLVQLRLRFRVGKAGMKTGGGIRLATAHGMGTDWGGQKLQVKDPAGENYLTFRTSPGSTLVWTSYNTGRTPLFNRYHPWQLINEFKLTGPSLKPGDTIEITLGDRTGGSRGVRMQRYDEKAFLLKFYVDAFGTDDYLPLAHHPTMQVLAAPAAELNVIVPSGIKVSQAGWVNVWADDGYGNPAASYRGTIAFESDSLDARLPEPYTFRAEDNGVHRFQNVTFPREGTFHIRVKESVKEAQGKLPGERNSESNAMQVYAAEPREKIFWGDIHTHTMYSDGRGTPAETYDFGKRISALDFTAVSDHSFLVEDWMWNDIKATTNRFYQPGKFVTFLAYEWSGMTEVGGDHTSTRPIRICRSSAATRISITRICGCIAGRTKAPTTSRTCSGCSGRACAMKTCW